MLENKLFRLRKRKRRF